MIHNYTLFTTGDSDRAFRQEKAMLLCTLSYVYAHTSILSIVSQADGVKLITLMLPYMSKLYTCIPPPQEKNVAGVHRG